MRELPTEYGAELTEYNIVIVHGLTFLAQIARRKHIIFIGGDTPAYGRHS